MDKTIQTKNNFERKVIKPGKRSRYWFGDHFILDILGTSDINCEYNLITKELKLTSDTDFIIYE